MIVRPTAVASTFYPADPKRLRSDVERYLEAGRGSEPVSRTPKVIIAPHAGYIYSGPIAGSSFASLRSRRGEIERVVLIGPSHYMLFEGLATSGAEAMESPLGRVMLDRRSEERIERMPLVRSLAEAHRPEHALEVELPFLQLALGDFSLVALLVGDQGAAEVAEVLDELWGGDETLIVVSSDLSHYLHYEAARALDHETAKRVVGCSGKPEARGSQPVDFPSLESRALEPKHACGYRAINGLLHLLESRGLEGRVLDLRNSGDTAGGRDSVVGYGAFEFA